MKRSINKKCCLLASALIALTLCSSAIASAQVREYGGVARFSVGMSGAGIGGSIEGLLRYQWMLAGLSSNNFSELNFVDGPDTYVSATSLRLGGQIASETGVLRLLGGIGLLKASSDLLGGSDYESKSELTIPLEIQGVWLLGDNVGLGFGLGMFIFKPRPIGYFTLAFELGVLR